MQGSSEGVIGNTALCTVLMLSISLTISNIGSELDTLDPMGI